MKNLGVIEDPKDVTNKEYVDNVKKVLEEKIGGFEPLTNAEIDAILADTK